jgi:hypothetical protein
MKMASEEQVPARTSDSAPNAKVVESDGHYLLNCRECGFTHHIPRDCNIPPVAFFVDADRVRMMCVYGGAFMVTLGIADFFTVTPDTSFGKVLHASIGDNMKVLHSHILSHCDPVFLIIQQSPNSTTHEYKRQPVGSTFVKISKDHGVDIVGNIDPSKAEIPGVSW